MWSVLFLLLGDLKVSRIKNECLMTNSRCETNVMMYTVNMMNMK